TLPFAGRMPRSVPRYSSPRSASASSQPPQEMGRGPACCPAQAPTGARRCTSPRDRACLGMQCSTSAASSSSTNHCRARTPRGLGSFERGRVTEVRFSTPYYRTKNGFGVGSRIPLGPCHRTMGYRCLHLWHGFMWNLRLRENPCSCWVKVGRGTRSLPATGDNFLKPWFFIYVDHGRVSRFYFA